MTVAPAASLSDPRVQRAIQRSVRGAVNRRISSLRVAIRRQAFREVLEAIHRYEQAERTSEECAEQLSLLRADLSLRLADTDKQFDVQLNSLLGAIRAGVDGIWEGCVEAREARSATEQRLEGGLLPAGSSRRPYGEGASADSGIKRAVDDCDLNRVRRLRQMHERETHRPAAIEFVPSLGFGGGVGSASMRELEPLASRLVSQLKEQLSPEKTGPVQDRLDRLEGRVEEVLRRLGEMARFRPSGKAASPAPAPVKGSGSVTPRKSGVLADLFRQNVQFRQSMRSDSSAGAKRGLGQPLRAPEACGL